MLDILFTILFISSPIPAEKPFPQPIVQELGVFMTDQDWKEMNDNLFWQGFKDTEQRRILDSFIATYSESQKFLSKSEVEQVWESSRKEISEFMETIKNPFFRNQMIRNAMIAPLEMIQIFPGEELEGGPIYILI